MGQYRYSGSQKEDGSSECCKVIYNTYPNNGEDDNSTPLIPFYYETEAESGMWYQDVIIPFTSSAVKIDDLFYVDMSIAPDGIGDTVYSLKLINKDEWGVEQTKEGKEELNFETIASFTVPKTSMSGAEAVGVSLYVPAGEDKTYSPVVGRIKSDPDDTKGTLSLENGVLKDASGQIISYHNDIYLLPTWQTEIPEGIRYEYSSFAGSKYNGGNFDAFLLEIQRGEVDKTVATEANGRRVMGRFLNVSDSEANLLDVKVSQITKILPSVKNTTIKQIGVWGRSGLPLILNGEEVKIGPSGYFELKNFDLVSIGVLANGSEDKFTIDYLYEND